MGLRVWGFKGNREVDSEVACREHLVGGWGVRVWGFGLGLRVSGSGSRIHFGVFETPKLWCRDSFFRFGFRDAFLEVRFGFRDLFLGVLFGFMDSFLGFRSG